MDFTVKDIPKYFEKLGSNLKKLFNNPIDKINDKNEKINFKENLKKYIDTLVTKTDVEIDTTKELSITLEEDKKTNSRSFKKIFYSIK